MTDIDSIIQQMADLGFDIVHNQASDEYVISFKDQYQISCSGSRFFFEAEKILEDLKQVLEQNEVTEVPVWKWKNWEHGFMIEQRIPTAFDQHQRNPLGGLKNWLPNVEQNRKISEGMQNQKASVPAKKSWWR